MADVKDILNISSDKTPNKVESILSGKKRTPTATQKRKKPEGVSREVFALQESTLLGVGPVITAPPPQAPVFKEKRIVEEEAKVSWVWKGFRNSARRDGAIFKHWIRTDEEQNDYKFARYNRKLKIQTYTNDEYEKHLQDPNWTREDTDHLFDLCRRFDLRFVVIADRFEGSKPKSIEDLKERFYSISSKLVDVHKFPDEDLSNNPLYNYTFNKKQEEDRKQQCDKLFLRTAAQVQEEEALVEQFRRIEGDMKKHNKAKKRIAHLMQYALNASSNPTLPTPSTPNFAADYTTPPPKTKKRKSHPDDDDEAYEPEADETPVSRPRKEKGSANRFQSTPLPMGTKTAYRVDSALVELGLIRNDAPPVPHASVSSCVMPVIVELARSTRVGERSFFLNPSLTTRKVTKALAEIRQDLVILLDLQKYVPQKEYQLEVMRAHKEGLLKEFTNRNIPVPSLQNASSDRSALALSSSTSVFGLSSLGDADEGDGGLMGDETFAPPPSRVRNRDKEKRSYKKSRMVVE